MDSEIWLKRNIEPRAEIISHWKKAYPLRKMRKFMTICDYLDEWPILKTDVAPDLVSK